MKKILFTTILVFSFAFVSDSWTTVYAFTNESCDITSSRADDIQYRYKFINGRLYKRLYNYSTGEWIGDWIPA